MIDGKLQLKHAPAAKTSDINKNKKNVMRCKDGRSVKSRETIGRDESIKQFSRKPHPIHL